MRVNPVDLVRRRATGEEPLPITKSTPGEQAFNLFAVGAIFLGGILAAESAKVKGAKARLGRAGSALLMPP